MTSSNDDARTIVARVRRRLRHWGGRTLRLARHLAIGGTLAAGAVMGLYPHHAPSWAAFFGLAGFTAILASPILGIVGAALNAGPRSRPAKVELIAEGVRYKPEKGIPTQLHRAGIASGIIVPKADAFELRLVENDGNEISFFVDHEHEAVAILDALGLDTASRRTDLSWRRFFDLFIHGFLGMLGIGPVVVVLSLMPIEAGYGALGGTLIMTLPWILSAFIAKQGARREVSIGREGFSHRFGWRRRSVILFSDIRRVDLSHSTLIFTLHDGKRISVKIDQGVELATGIHRRIEEARALLDGAEPSTRAMLFERGERAFDEWKLAMRHLLETGGGFRDGALRRDHAMEVVEDIEAPLEARVGAALALSALDDVEPKERLRVAAEGTVHPKVRIALQEASAGEASEVHLEEAVEAVERAASA